MYKVSKMLIKETKEEQLQCEFCRSLFSGKADLEVHMRSHLGDEPLLCEICGMGFSQKGNLNKHRKLCQDSSESKPLYFATKIDDTNLHNNLNESIVGTSDILDLPSTLTATVETQHEQNTSNSKNNQECIPDIGLEQNEFTTMLNTEFENIPPEQSLCTGNMLEEIVPQDSAVVSVSMKETNNTYKQTGKTDKQDQTACTAQLYNASFHEIEAKQISLPGKAITLSDVNEQKPAVETESGGANINIGSQQNIQIYTERSSYTQSEQSSFVLKFINNDRINVQQELHTSSQVIETSGVQTETDKTHGVSLDCENKNEHLENQQDVTLTNKKMDFCSPYNVKDDFFVQSADKLSFNSSNDYIGNSSIVASELGFVHIPICPENANETEFQLNDNSSARAQKDCGSGCMKEKGCMYNDPQTFNNDSINCFTNENVSLSGSTQMSKEDIIPYGPANFNDKGFDNYGNGKVKAEDFEQNVTIDISEKEFVRYGPANINEDDFFSYEHSQVRGRDFDFNGPANVSDRNFVSHELKGRGKKDFELNGPENIGEKNSVFYGPLNFNEIDYGSYGHSKSTERDCSLDSCVDTCINEGVQYGPANINEDDFVRQKDFVLNGHRTFIGKDFISVNQTETSGKEFVFSEPVSISEKRSVTYCPVNANDDDHDQYTRLNETELVQYGPANIHKTLHNTETFCEGKLAHSVDLDYSSLLEFPGLMSRDPKQADTCMIPVRTDTAMDHDYTIVGNQEPRNNTNRQGYVADVTDKNVTVKSCGKATPFDSSVNPSTNNKSYSADKHIDSIFNKSNNLADEALSHTLYSQETESAVAGLLRNDCSNATNITELTVSISLPTEIQLTYNTQVGHSDSLGTSFKFKHLSKPQQTFLLCEICSLRVPDKAYLDKHLLTHTGKGPFPCGICQKTFTEQSNLKIHLKMCGILNANPGLQECSSGVKIFSGDSPFMCNICTERFSHKSSLKKHMLSHIQQKLHICNICSKQFRRKSTLQSHLRTHTGERPFKCKFCDKSYLQSSQLGVHVRSCHTGEKPYVCDTCNKGYADKSHYDRHMVTHSGKKTFVCDLCGKAFGQRYQLKQHMKSHSENKQDICDKCHKSFSSKNSLKLHLKKCKQTVTTEI